MPDMLDCTMEQKDHCGYWDHPQQDHKMCGSCDSCTGYGDYLHEQWKDRQMDDCLDRRGK